MKVHIEVLYTNIQKDITPIYNYLVLCGYCPDFVLSEDEKEKLILYRHAKHILFIHPQKKVIIEIHWKITDALKSFYSDFDFIYGQLTTNQVFMNREFRVLNKEYDLLYLLVHGSEHKWQRLKWLLDINDYIRNIPIDGLQINTLAQKHGISGLLALYNSLSKIYFPEPKLFETKLKVSRFLLRICIEHIEANEVVLTGRHIFHSLNLYIYSLLLFPDFGNRMAFLKNNLLSFSDSKDIKTANPLLLMLYRPFGYFYRHRPGNY